MTTPKQTSVVKSADRVLDILELLAVEQHSINLVEIARKLDMPTSSTYKILQNMLARGYLETDVSEKMFKLGYKVLEIATKYSQNTDLISQFQNFAQKIVQDINEAAFLSIREKDMILYVSEKQSSHPVRFVSHMGMKLPIHSTAMGKAMLSKLTDQEIYGLFPSNQLGKLTDGTIQEREQLLKQMEEIRQEGLAYSYGEAIQGVQCVAAPICNAKGDAAAAMSISIPAARFTPEIWEKAKAWVTQGAKELSLSLFYQPHESNQA
ncbi:IclR family transcriptional regulator [Paenibacillus spongiae]|uniref:IclR family transcriptional regulator n=1 Tax=Paenibacillus spongiae TaxID=2909671 RepID=A0ABY5S3G4_9BACL|nr:IclR family transcriptional regulator [Paenibacillus spongiae]UVI28013.1 IclR family transcriptional regulator [Paenibacillus spongiae]